MLGSQSLEAKYIMMREALHKPISTLADGFGLKVNALRQETDDYGQEEHVPGPTTLREWAMGTGRC